VHAFLSFIITRYVNGTRARTRTVRAPGAIGNKQRTRTALCLCLSVSLSLSLSLSPVDTTFPFRCPRPVRFEPNRKRSLTPFSQGLVRTRVLFPSSAVTAVLVNGNNTSRTRTRGTHKLPPRPDGGFVLFCVYVSVPNRPAVFHRRRAVVVAGDCGGTSVYTGRYRNVTLIVTIRVLLRTHYLFIYMLYVTIRTHAHSRTSCELVVATPCSPLHSVSVTYARVLYSVHVLRLWCVLVFFYFFFFKHEFSRSLHSSLSSHGHTTMWNGVGSTAR
jgi:hypothetical protein